RNGPAGEPVLEPVVRLPRGDDFGQRLARAAVEHVLAARRVEEPVRCAVHDRLRRPTVDELPMNPVRAAGHAETAPLAFVEGVALRALVFPVDVEEAHLVTARWIGIA